MYFFEWIHIQKKISLSHYNITFFCVYVYYISIYLYNYKDKINDEKKDKISNEKEVQTLLFSSDNTRISASQKD